MRRVLVADDTEDIRYLLQLVLSGPFEVVGAAVDGLDALRLWEEHRHEGLHALVLDHRMPRMTGLEVAERVLADDPTQRVLLFSANVDDQLRRDALAIGCTAVLHKEALPELAQHPALAA